MGLKGKLLRSFLASRGEIIVGLMGRAPREDLRIVGDTRALAPLLVQDAAALLILSCGRHASRLGAAMAEVGVYMGGTARLICEVKGEAALHLFDVFESLQEPSQVADTDRARELRTHGTHDALEFFHPRLVPGGVIVGDDCNDTGVRRAFDRFFAGRPDPVIAMPWGQALVVKV